jgi:predicted PurR-regulated permease PerM
MSRTASFVALVAVLLAIAMVFVVVMAGFILPLFIALLLAVIFQPLHQWFITKCKGRFRIAAALATGAIAIIVLLPLSGIFVLGASEGLQIYESIEKYSTRAAPRKPAPEGGAASNSSTGGDSSQEKSLADAIVDLGMLARAVVQTGNQFGLELSEKELERAIREKLDVWIGPVALGTAKFFGKLLIVLGVTVISTYYFLADGPWMVRKIMHLSPLDDSYEEQLFEEFVRVTRAVVVATLLSAVVQGLLAGLGFTLLGLPAVFLLMGLTMFLAMIPFVGAGAVWLPVCVWLFFFSDPPRTWAAVFLAIYGAGIVSMADNVIKPLVLHGRSNMHPLLALLSVIGGVRTMGPIGIFVGPMVVAFLHSLLNMFHSELGRMGTVTSAPQEERPPPDAKEDHHASTADSNGSITLPTDQTKASKDTDSAKKPEAPIADAGIRPGRDDATS